MKRPLVPQLKEIAGDRRDDAVWTRRAAGEATADEDAALRAKAADDPEAALLLHATRSRAPADDDALLDLITGAAPAPARASAVRLVQNAPDPSEARAPVRRLPTALRWGAPVLAAAAALVLFVRTRPPPDSALPAFALEVYGTNAGERGDPVTPPPPTRGVRRVVSAGARLTIVARPAERVAGGVAASAFVIARGTTRALPAPRLSPAGTAILEGSRDEIFPSERGAVDVVVFVGRPDAIPRTVAAVGASSAQEETSVQRLVVELDLP